jgi:hypothetical protein
MPGLPGVGLQAIARVGIVAVIAGTGIVAVIPMVGIVVEGIAIKPPKR